MIFFFFLSLKVRPLSLSLCFSLNVWEAETLAFLLSHLSLGNTSNCYHREDLLYKSIHLNVNTVWHFAHSTKSVMERCTRKDWHLSVLRCIQKCKMLVQIQQQISNNKMEGKCQVYYQGWGGSGDNPERRGSEIGIHASPYTHIHTFIHLITPTEHSQSTYQNVSEKWDETGEPRANPCWHMENMRNSAQTVNWAQDRPTALLCHPHMTGNTTLITLSQFLISSLSLFRFFVSPKSEQLYVNCHCLTCPVTHAHTHTLYCNYQNHSWRQQKHLRSTFTLVDSRRVIMQWPSPGSIDLSAYPHFIRP